MLRADGISVGRGGITLLDGISFELGAGDGLIVTGPNGIGKTTLLRALVGLQPVLTGTISGEDPAYSGHSDAIKATLTVSENLYFWAQIFGTKDIEPAINAFDLGSLRDRVAGKLSAGQRRRLGLARMMVTGRNIWVMDEPTVSLDAVSVERFAQVIQHHLANGGAAIIATHLDLGIKAKSLDVSTHKATTTAQNGFEEAFL